MNELVASTALLPVLAVADLIATIIAIYIFVRLIKVSATAGATDAGLLAAGFLMLAIALSISAISYVWVPLGRWGMMHDGTHGMHGMHMEGDGWPMHWMMSPGGYIYSHPLSLVVDILYLAAYAVILAGMLVSYRGFSGFGRASTAMAVGVLIPLALAVNAASVILLLAIIAAIIMNYEKIPVPVVGYVILAMSHGLEILVIFGLPLETILAAEILKPLALLVIGLGLRK
jgi:hypothetical protein